MLKKFLLLIVVLALGALLWKWEAVQAQWASPSGSTETEGESASSIARVITTPVKIQAYNREFEAMGTGRARQSVQIYPAVSEEVTAVNFEAGEMVEPGDVLVQLDDRDEKLAVRLAEVRLAEAGSLLNRYELAVKDGAVPQSEVDSARASVDVARVELDKAKLDLEKRRILAPFRGVVGLPKVDPGDRVDPGTVITGLDDRSVLQVDFEVPEALAGELERGQTIIANTPAYPQQQFEGVIQALESRIDPENRTIMARAIIENNDDLLRPGMSFATRLVIPGGNYATVPEIALQWGRDGSFVWVVKDEVANRVPVEVISRTSGRVMVNGEIAEGDPVVMEGLQRLQDGRPVKTVNPAEAGNS